jgi:hypothetical protein
VASVAALTELAALWPGDVVVEIVLLPPQLHVPAAHGDVVEEDVAAGMSAHRGRLIQQEPGSGVGAPFRDYQRRTRGQPGRIRLQEWTIGSARPFSAGPNSTRCSFALLRNPDLTSGSWPETREVSNCARFSGTTGRRGAFLASR